MALKKNIYYNSLLTIANYIFPLIVFPYVTRVLGAEKYGIYNFVDSVINYYIMFATMGITTVGIREIARTKNNKNELNKTFSSLFILNAISTIIILIIFTLSIFFVNQFKEQKSIFFIGSAKIIFNLFLIEWLFIGTGNFKFITIRSIIIKFFYVISVFIFVRQENDYGIYYFLTVSSVGINAFINWFYRRKITSFSLKRPILKPYLNSFFILGARSFLISMYTTFNVVYLGFIGGNAEVGYYTAATKIQGILLSLYSAYSSVIMPHISFLISQDKQKEIKNLINKSFEALYIFCIPIIYLSTILAPDIINILSGPNYKGAVLPLRIVMPLILIIGMEQILIVQILTPLKKDKAILINTILGALAGIISNMLLVGRFKSIGSSIVWCNSELIVLLSAIYFVNKNTDIQINFKKLFFQIIIGLPYLLISLFSTIIFKSPLITIMTSSCLSLLYFYFIQVKIMKNKFAISLIKEIKGIGYLNK